MNLTGFIILNVINVIIQTIKSIATIKGGKITASIANALAYGFYTYIVIYMCDESLDNWKKALIIGLSNLVGVYFVKLFEEKKQKDKLWLVQATCKSLNTDNMSKDLEEAKIPYNYTYVNNNYTMFNCYCNTQKDSKKAKEILDKYKAKYFASESKTLI
jgi:uncharacterized protein YebE (UPF0316 family)